jgi:hypothetical protein
VLAAGQRPLEEPEPFDNLIGGVDIKRRAITPSQARERNAATVKNLAAARINKRT